MEFSSFTFIVTYDCDYKCTYCYQKKGKEYLDYASLKKTLEFFFPYFSPDCYLNFYGGEPLLALELIKDAVDHTHRLNQTHKKKIRFSLTTNGSRLDDAVLGFLNQHRFSVLLSFDGLAQDLCRKKGSFNRLASLLKKIQEYPGIELQTNSVFTRETVDYLAKSARFMVESGVADVDLSFSTLPPWDDTSLDCLKEQLSILSGFLREYYQRNREIPVTIFRKFQGNKVFGCSAGRDRMTLSTDGKLWGCCFFNDFFRDKPERKGRLRYCFGDLEKFMEDHESIYPGIISNHDFLRMDYFFTPQEFCMMCEHVEDCVVCPLDAAFGSSVVGMIPLWVCRLRKLILEERNLFLEDLGKSK